MISKYEYDKRIIEINNIINLIKIKKFNNIKELEKFLKVERKSLINLVI